MYNKLHDLILRNILNSMYDFPIEALVKDGRVYAIVTYKKDTLSIEYRRREDIED